MILLWLINNFVFYFCFTDCFYKTILQFISTLVTLSQSRRLFKVKTHWLNSRWVLLYHAQDFLIVPLVHHLQKMQPHPKHATRRLLWLSLLFLALLYLRSLRCRTFSLFSFVDTSSCSSLLWRRNRKFSKWCDKSGQKWKAYNHTETN